MPAYIRQWCEVLLELRRESEYMMSDQQRRIRIAIGRDTAGQPRTYRLSRSSTRDAAYRRLAVTILGLDVATLALELRAARRARQSSALAAAA